MKYYIADVFCKKKYSGNQLAVVFVSEKISENEMQKIASEFHFSETTFVFPKDKQEKSYRVRIFTPQNEVPFAGHPTLGTAYIIRNELEKDVSKIVLNLNVGRIPVIFDDTHEIQWMKQIEPVFGSKHITKDIAEIISLSEDDIDERFPVQGVSTGLEFLIVPLKGIAAVKRAYTNLDRYKEYFKETDRMPLFIFSPETYEKGNHVNCRMFADVFGIPEDPATGSANGCLAAYLSKYRFFGTENINAKIEQGYEINRESILHIRTSFENGRYNIEVGGKVIKVAQGNLL